MLSYSAEYLIKDFRYSDTKNGNKMGKLLLEDTITKELLNGVLWQDTLDIIDINTLRYGNIIKIVSGEYREQYRNIIIKQISLIKEAPAGLSEKERNLLFEKISLVIDSFNDKKLKNDITNIINENINLFKISPAARSIHHNYVGGLMQHISECIDFAKILFPQFCNNVNKEAVLAACITHDIGKMFEYEIDVKSGLVQINEGFRKEWISHTQYGYTWAMGNNLKFLARIIASHHGRAEWDAIIDLNQKDLESELYLMHYVDNLSAKFGMIDINLFQNNNKKS